MKKIVLILVMVLVACGTPDKIDKRKKDTDQFITGGNDTLWMISVKVDRIY